MASIARLLLIAGREFNAYVATASFWLAMLIGPLVMAGALALSGLASSRPADAQVAIRADEPRLAAAAAAALAQAARLEGRSAPRIVAGPAAAGITVARLPDGAVGVRFDGPLALTPSGRALVAAIVERDDAVHRLGRTPQAPPSFAAARSPLRPEGLARFALVMMLWLTLTGSLGMLLQAVVRERTNRALEILLAAAQPWEIVFGKLAGVGGVSLLVLSSWLGSSAALAALAPGAGGAFAPLFQTLSQPGLLAYAVVVYLLAYLLFGLVTVAVGAAAADTAAAQNLSRPMFAVLLAVFFAALTAAGGASDRLAWLVYVPPFAPFMLLLKTQPIGAQIGAAALLGVSIIVVAAAAVRGVGLQSRSRPFAWPGFMQSKPRLAQPTH